MRAKDAENRNRIIARAYIRFRLYAHRPRDDQCIRAGLSRRLFQPGLIDFFMVRNIPIARQRIDTRGFELGHKLVFEVAADATLSA